ncbi:MAG: hypothetical protein ABSG25_07640 [Bryobacteraceae bacterium]
MNRMSSFLILALASGMGCTVNRHAQNCSGCSKPELVPARLRRIASLNWAQIDQTVIGREWPEAKVIPLTYMSAGPGVLEAAIERSCNAGQDLTSAEFIVPPLAWTLSKTQPPANPSGLWTAEVFLCRPTKKQAIDAVQKLIDAVVPEHPGTKHADAWSASDNGQGVYAARWEFGQERFVLSAHAAAGLGRLQGKWIGLFSLTRTPPVDVIETWTLDGGSQVKVLRLEIEQSGQPPEKVLRFAYLTDCVASDMSCWSKELTAFWPRLRTRAERKGIRKVEVSVEDGARGWSFMPRLNADGKWVGPSFLKY